MESLSMVLAIILAGLFLLGASVKVVQQYERGVVLTLGRFTGIRGPGITLLIPVLQRMFRVDMRVWVMEVDPQDVISKDNVTVKVTAVIYAQVTDAAKALLDVVAYRSAVQQLAPTMLRSVLGAHTLDELLQRQESLKAMLKEQLDSRTEAWGVEVQNVEIRSIDLDANMIRAMAQAAEAERGRQARIITAEGEAQAAEKLAEAAKLMERAPNAMVLRTLATLKEIAAESNSTIIFPMPIETMMPSILNKALEAAKGEG